VSLEWARLEDHDSRSKVSTHCENFEGHYGEGPSCALVKGSRESMGSTELFWDS
jgi:hypothetical protein